ncbi:MAG: DNA-directed RNA polymerase subunit beta [Faunusvirus sp.]|jgi:DNA-directed RNA polymerase II subunit RPB2|uniref:DNA-directed RNA polymerase n=1 Tax=Faunusvirus sp. TaxID=2487766 RepID=A0A3G4ZX17_9VIRU|nr:MAG: DNA-directed RNA polymerase subunit beta [Faunusvirus sp.]
MKPDKDIVAGTKDVNYDKLNEDGFIPPETPVEEGDVIIGKVSPIPAGSGTKLFKDSSQIYRSSVPGIVDKVYSKIVNQDGYEIIKMKIRQERAPEIGDKVCSRHGQKGERLALVKLHNNLASSSYIEQYLQIAGSRKTYSPKLI